MSLGLSDSQFYMWRTLFALAHADHVVTSEEVRFMAEAMEDIPFSDEQQVVLKRDTFEQQDIEAMFSGITDHKDQAAFFKYAHILVHVDGEYSVEEQDVLLRLKEGYMKIADVSDLVGGISLEFEDDMPEGFSSSSVEKEKTGFEKMLSSLRGRSLGA